jgi:hypothetical protein
MGPLPKFTKTRPMFFPNAWWIRSLLLLLVAGFFTAAMPLPTFVIKKRFFFDEGSRLYLNGSSNVNKFTCDCTDRHDGQWVDAERKPGGQLKFKNLALLLKTKSFDCHNRKIDADLQKALRADQYPNIKITLLETKQNEKCLDGNCTGWFDVQAKTAITITHTTKEMTIPAKARKLGHNRFQLVGQKELYMSSFGVDPPEAMFGMIKVDDKITFHFDLMISVDEVQ